MELRWMTRADLDAVQGADVFDNKVRHEWARDFLADPRHHLCFAYVGAGVAGFVSAVELTHPDKGTEMFLYELGVNEAFRRAGIGKALVAALLELAELRGCYGMWGLTDSDNEPALRTYHAVGAPEREDPVLLTWHLGSQDGTLNS